MAPVTNVVILTPHGRRVNIKVLPDTILMKVLEDVCRKFDFAVEEHDLKHHNKVLDLTMVMRFSGLPNNANLELCTASKKRTESSVIILVQLENGNRLTGNFSPSDSMWQVVSTLCNDEVTKMNSPVIIFTRTEICGQENMKATSLRSLGLMGGRAMFRLLNRTEEQLRYQANVSAPLPRPPPPPSPPICPKTTQTIIANHVTAFEPQPGPSTQEFSGTDSPPPKKQMIHSSNENNEVNIAKRERQIDLERQAQAMLEKQEMERQLEIEKEVEKELIVLGERNAVVFNRLLRDPSLNKEEELPNDFFELTIEDAKLIIRDLRRQREQLDDQPFKTAAIRELEENTYQLALLQKYKHTVIRIHFQDGIVLQAVFKPVESGECVYNFVRSYLREPDHAFELYTTPPKRILKCEDRLIEAQCVPRAILYFSTAVHSSPVLQERLMEQLSSPAAALLAAKRSKNS